MQKLKVLIVEDNKVNRKLLENALKDEVFEKKSAENGHEALRCYREWKPDIILLDILLPLVSGYSVLQEIRIKERDMSTIIIITSGLTFKQDIIDCAKLGIHGYLVKPINFRELSGKILEYYSKGYPGKTMTTDELIKIIKDKTEAEDQPAEIRQQ